MLKDIDFKELDKILIEIKKCIKNNKYGVFNLASGIVSSFNKIAKIVVTLTNSKSKILNTKRVGLMPHNGYRPFNVTFIKKNFKIKMVNSW